MFGISRLHFPLALVLRAPRWIRSADESPFLRDLAESLIKKESEAQQQGQQQPPQEKKVPGYVLMVAESLDHALEVVGRSGKETLYRVIENSFGLQKEDIASRPGQYMSALRSMLGESCNSIEKYMLDYIEERTGVSGISLEDTVEMLRAADRKKREQQERQQPEQQV